MKCKKEGQVHTEKLFKMHCTINQNCNRSYIDTTLYIAPFNLAPLICNVYEPEEAGALKIIYIALAIVKI